jgi:hypothetical protein
MWKEQITDMPVYKNTGTTGRFKANRGAGSICNMVTMLVKGFAAGFPDSSKAPKAKTIYGKQKWAAPSGGWKFDGDAMLLQKGEAAKEAKARLLPRLPPRLSPSGPRRRLMPPRSPAS